MEEPHVEGVATRDDPESCGSGREVDAEALTGHVWTRYRAAKSCNPGSRRCYPKRKAAREAPLARGANVPARSKTRRTHGSFLHENREIPMPPVDDGAAGRAGKATSRNPAMNGPGKSDEPVVPMKRSNKVASVATEEIAEGRGEAKGNTAKRNADRTQSRSSPALNELDRVRRKAKEDKAARFTALLHHVTIERLGAAYGQLKKNAAPGVDGVTWEQYGVQIEDNLKDLHARLHRGAYRAKPSRRTYIPKADGRQRPRGIASLEDKIVQRAVVEVMNAIYEEDFLGFSYGFRPGRGQHDALMRSRPESRGER